MAASNPRSSTIHLHFAGPPAIPIVRQPLIFAICPTTDPVAPAAPETTTVSPSLGRPTSRSPKYAVRPVAPSALIASGMGTPAGTRVGAEGPLPVTRA